MFILDLFKFCEIYGRFNRQHLAVFIYRHKDCERMAKAAGVNTRYFASSASKEFLARCMTEGYIDGVGGNYWSKGSTKRPFGFSFRCLGGESDKYTNEMMTIKEMTDDQLFA